MMTGPPPAIVARGLQKRYGPTVAVDGVDLDVSAGTVYGFLGPNGAGKTTTMRMLTGLVEPSSGHAEIAGVPVDDRRELVDRIGLLPEEPPLYDELTGREQLEYAVDLRGVDWDTVAADARSMCERLDLHEALDRRIEGYSKGMRQKTAYVQAVLHDPEVVFLDEPTAGLDPRAAKTLRELVAELATGDTTVFLSTHVLPVVEEIADRVGVLYDGRIVAEDAPGELSDSVGEAHDRDGEANLEAAFLDLTEDAGIVEQ